MRSGYPMAQSGVQSGQFADKYTVRQPFRKLSFSPESETNDRETSFTHCQQAGADS